MAEEYVTSFDGKIVHVYVDQDLDTGDGLNEAIAPNIFVMADDGFSYVRPGADAQPIGYPYISGSGQYGVMPVRKEDFEIILEMAEEQPSECTHFLALDSPTFGVINVRDLDEIDVLDLDAFRILQVLNPRAQDSSQGRELDGPLPFN